MTSSFTCTPVHEGNSIRILSVCKSCGASRVVSVSDGSLDEWQRTHECGTERKPPRPQSYPQRRSNGANERG